MRRGALIAALVFSLGAHAKEAIYVMPGLSLSRIPAAQTAPIRWAPNTTISAAKNGIWVLGQGNLWRLGQKTGIFISPARIRSFARSDAGTLVASIDGRIGLISGRLFLPAMPAPESGTLLAGGSADTLILYDPTVPAHIYSFDGKRVATLATLDQPITALTHIGDTIIFASPDGIYSLRAGRPLGLLFPLAGHAPVTALAANPKTAELFAATHDAVYQIDEGRMTEIIQGVGGALAVLDGHVLIADPLRKTIFILGVKHEH